MIVTGVQVLFAFLLVVPFNTGFAHVGDFERTVYMVTLLLVTAKLFGAGAGALAAGVCSIPFVALWFAIPVARRVTLDESRRR